MTCMCPPPQAQDDLVVQLQMANFRAEGLNTECSELQAKGFGFRLHTECSESQAKS